MLRWSLQHGAAYREAVEAGEAPDVPDPPELWPGLMGWYDVFFELSTDRQIGMACGPLPAASIARWTAGWPDEDAEAFRVAMREMDGVFLAHTSKSVEQPDPDFAGSDNPARDAFRAARRR